MSVSVPQSQSPQTADSAKDFSSVHPRPKVKAPLWLMILLAALTAIIFIWVMLIVAYPSLA